MSDKTIRLSLPLIAAGQSQKHVTHNAALDLLDRLVHLSVIDHTRAVAPTAPIEGDSHLVAPAATGAWANQSGTIASWLDGAWEFLIPRRGWRVWVSSTKDILAFDGTDWVGLPGKTTLTQLGINATADLQNRLSVASPSSLLNHEGAGHQLKINKAASGDTASLLFQNAFSGRAEMGLAGDENWQLKVSPDGNTWLSAVSVNRNTGVVSMPLTPGREKLTAARSYFVRTNGNDNNTGNGNTATTAFRTIQKAMNVVLGTLDLAGFDVTIQVATGTYNESVVVPAPQVGSGRIILSGDITTPSNVTINSGAATSIFVKGAGSRLHLRGIRVTNIGYAGWHADAGGFIQTIGPNEIGATGTFQIVSDGTSVISMGTALTVSGGCTGAHMLAQNNGTINVTSGSWTFVGSPNFGSSFVNAITGGVIFAYANIFNGTATCARYFATLNGVIQTNGGGATYFPGSTAGAVATGGQYG